MIKKIIFIELFLISFFAMAQNKPFHLFSSSSDANHKVVRVGEPFEIFKNGKYLETILTNKNGKLFTNFRTPNTNEDFLVRSLNDEYVIFVNQKNVVTKSYSTSNSPNSLDNCGEYNASEDCTGKGFYWIKLYNVFDYNYNSMKDNNEDFELNLSNLDYVIVDNNEKIVGKTDESGNIYIANQADYKTKKINLFLPLLNIEYEIEINQNKEKSYFKVIKSEKSTDLKFLTYQNKYKNFNNGFPYIQSGWSKGLTELEKRNEYEAEEHKISIEKVRNQSEYDAKVESFLKDKKNRTYNDCDWNSKEFQLHSFFRTTKTQEMYATWLNIHDDSGIVPFSINLEENKIKFKENIGKAIDISTKEDDTVFSSKCKNIIFDNKILIQIDLQDVPNDDKYLLDIAEIVENCTDIKPSIEHFKSIQYLLIYEFNISGVTGGFLVLPIEKISN